MVGLRSKVWHALVAIISQSCHHQEDKIQSKIRSRLSLHQNLVQKQLLCSINQSFYINRVSFETNCVISVPADPWLCLANQSQFRNHMELTCIWVLEPEVKQISWKQWFFSFWQVLSEIGSNYVISLLKSEHIGNKIFLFLVSFIWKRIKLCNIPPHKSRKTLPSCVRNFS